MTKNHTRGVYKMSKAEQSFASELFSRISELKSTDFEHYNSICSYLRYPFQQLQSGL